LPAEDKKQYLGFKLDKEYLEVTLSDNGIGFSQQYAEQIFTIFQRLNDKSKYGGYGIGLALCRRIIENHNGIIFAKGTENEGATFVFILPLKH
jgi:signal transduction histidine kinase